MRPGDGGRLGARPGPPCPWARRAVVPLPRRFRELLTASWRVRSSVPKGDILMQEETGPHVTVYRPGVECDELSFLKWMNVLPGERVSRSVFLPRLLLSLPVSVNLHTAFSCAQKNSARPSFRGAPVPSTTPTCCSQAWGQRARPPPGALCRYKVGTQCRASGRGGGAPQRSVSPCGRGGLLTAVRMPPPGLAPASTPGEGGGCRSTGERLGTGAVLSQKLFLLLPRPLLGAQSPIPSPLLQTRFWLHGPGHHAGVR